MNKLFVGNLNFNVSEAVLEMFVQEFGVEVEKVNIIRDRDTGKSRGFGFIELGRNQDMDEAISVLNDKNLEGRTLRVSQAHERSGQMDRRSPGRNPY